MGLRFCSSLALLALTCAGLSGADPVEAVFAKAASALASQDYAAAELGFLSVLKSQPGNMGALGNLGVVYSRTHRYVQAVDAYKRALRIAPRDPALSTNLGLAYIKQEQYADALPIFEKLAAGAQNLQARELVATCRLALGQFESALAVLQPLRDAEPASPGVLYMLGVVFTRLKRPEEAQEAYVKMMEAVSPAQANFLMGKASYETGQFEQAAESFRKALEFDPRFEDAHRELGKTLISLRDNNAAETELRQADPADAEALYFLGGLLAQSHPAEAIPKLKRAHELSPDFWGSLYYLGRIYLEQGRLKEALLFLERAVKLKPDEPAIQYQLGRALQKAGREAEARAAFARVKEMKSRGLQKEVDILSPEQVR